MYHALLANRYLTSRVIPFVAVAAVALCVALVIIVVSIMTGFLDMVRSSGRTLMGDVIIAYPVSGIPYYQRLIDRIERLPEAEAASPMVDSWGLLRMPYPDGPNKETETVQLWGIEPESFARVTCFQDTLYWRPYTDDEVAEMGPDDLRRLIIDSKHGDRSLAEVLLDDGLSLHHSISDRPGILLGIHVSVANERQKDGSVKPMVAAHWWMPRFEVTLTTLPIASGGTLLEPESFILPVVNEFQSGVYLIDDKRVMIPLEIAQRMLHLNEAQRVDDEQLDDEGLPKVIGVDPRKATQVLVRAAAGVQPEDLQKLLVGVYEAFYAEVLADEDALVKPPLPDRVSIKTWEQQQAQFIDPIKKERELMRTLFSLVYLVCAGLVLSIFWAIVHEKTRDIGILRSIGASRLGISWIFLRYGLAIGIGGSIAGVGLAYLVVHNINAIHTALGDPPVSLAVAILVLALGVIALTIYKGRLGDLMPITLGALVSITLIGAGTLILLLKQRGGVVLWDPSVYYFTKIPNAMDTFTAIFSMVGAVIFSLIGAFLPAAKAADTDPVQALRYE